MKVLFFFLHTFILVSTRSERKLPIIPKIHIDPIITKAITNLRVKHVTCSGADSVAVKLVKLL